MPTIKNRKEETIQVLKSSGNVFKDIGVNQSDEYRAKANLAIQIIQIIENKKISQKEAALKIDAAQPDISRLKSGQLNGFTIDRLISFLLKLNYKVEIRVSEWSGTRKAKMETIIV
ncbi:MAG: XRE family transcriptional regulator [Saprospiraceae bacterium]|nr:XRE family transcriptional regulator [Saprospiraceae bacterium]